MSRNNRAIRRGDVTREEAEEMSRQVRDLVAYLAKYDDPKFREQLGKIENPSGVLIMIQSGQRTFERGLSISTALIAVGSFNPTIIAGMVREWLMGSIEEAMLGREIDNW